MSNEPHPELVERVAGFIRDYDISAGSAKDYHGMAQAALAAIEAEHVVVPRVLVEEAAETIKSLQSWVVDEATGLSGCKDSRNLAKRLRAIAAQPASKVDESTFKKSLDEAHERAEEMKRASRVDPVRMSGCRAVSNGRGIE